ncbi:hypothetical protein WJX72_010946 [[Myrmecia] bisecta]|uniref:J domain-containing protein n=1 Tax=[Myrmecia] bisecta TaxID=41462 RepID=A0AAW1Q161_9CHLO
MSPDLEATGGLPLVTYIRRAGFKKPLQGTNELVWRELARELQPEWEVRRVFACRHVKELSELQRSRLIAWLHGPITPAAVESAYHQMRLLLHPENNMCDYAGRAFRIVRKSLQNLVAAATGQPLCPISWE